MFLLRRSSAIYLDYILAFAWRKAVFYYSGVISSLRRRGATYTDDTLPFLPHDGNCPECNE